MFAGVLIMTCCMSDILQHYFLGTRPLDCGKWLAVSGLITGGSFDV